MGSVRGAPTAGHFASYNLLSGEESSSMADMLVLKVVREVEVEGGMEDRNEV